jgi:DNA-binding response OmpR family regulator
VNVLVVDDDRSFAEGIAQALQQQDFCKAHVAHSFHNASQIIDQLSPEVVVADYRLTDGSGHDVALKARAQRQNSKIILMTAFADKDIAIESVNLGIDYFLEKPFELSLLRQVLSKLVVKTETPKKEFTLNDRDLLVSWGEESVRLTLKEFKILKYFLEHEGLRVSREQIVEKIWPREIIGSNVFDTHIYNLKVKLPFFKRSLSVVRGKGYCYHYVA